MKTTLSGFLAEKRALRFLRRQGLTHVASNYRSRYGEIDLIMQDQQTLVFVEVRYRKNNNFGGAAASIGLQKQRKIIKTSLSYCQAYKLDVPCRFDVIAIQGNDDIQWIPNAFDAS